MKRLQCGCADEAEHLRMEDKAWGIEREVLAALHVVANFTRRITPALKKLADTIRRLQEIGALPVEPNRPELPKLPPRPPLPPLSATRSRPRKDRARPRKGYPFRRM